MKYMTALVSCFARCYHTENNRIKIYDDIYAKSILTKEEYDSISSNMKNGIHFFNPNYSGEDPLTWIVNHQLSPSVLARSIFAEDYLKKKIASDIKQYLILASGYDTSACKLMNDIKIFELDHEDIIEDKQRRIQLAGISKNNVIYVGCDLRKKWIERLLHSGFSNKDKTFCTCLGMSYYLQKDEFMNLISDVSKNISSGSSIVFDYPNQFVTENEIINQKMARALNEEMKSTFTLNEIHEIAHQTNMNIEKHLNHNDIDNLYFSKYNKHNQKDEIHSPIGVSYCLLTKK